MQRRGFTIVEVMIVIVMITILTLLGIANLRNTQVLARDDERQAKAEAIARSLEVYYKSGYPALSRAPGQYPSVNDVNLAVSGGYITSWLQGIDESTLRYSWQPENASNFSTIGSSASPYANESPAIINAAVADGKIYYEPIRISLGTSSATDGDNWAPCYLNTHTCHRFNIYFKRESDNSLVTIRSLRQ